MAIFRAFVVSTSLSTSHVLHWWTGKLVDILFINNATYMNKVSTSYSFAVGWWTP